MVEENSLNNEIESVVKNNLDSKELKKDTKLSKLDILKKISSGTGLREALNNIVNSSKGALIVVSNQNAGNVFEGGFRINSKFTSKRLEELAKMDGAIILSEDFKKILFANTLLVPNRSYSTIETGTRHQAAERTAKQIGGMVIAVSERKGSITIYYRNSRYVLQKPEELLRRATETLQILEKQREVFDELILNLNLLELNNLVSVADVCTLLERIEMIRKMKDIINEYIIELGRDGLIVRMRMREITQGIENIRDLIFKDYLPKSKKVEQFFDSLSFDKLLDLKNIANNLFRRSLETLIVPKGYRILSKTSLNKDEIESLIRHFKNLDSILNGDEENLKKVISNPKKFQKEVNVLREHVMLGKKV
ncbi:DNA integrity scanning protein DisA [Candidatus Pacearchaeota archaeon]|nr:DNA integrity scanning protein DisA [Candidatus Pacearchaeota archaeon]MBD3283129.1 DNA integrity scanning protein DisA [Candidatus Pacearchaeota archaeon]